MNFLKEFLETEEGKDIRSKIEEHIQFNTGDKCPNMKLSENLEIRYDITEEPDVIIISESFANKLKQPIFRKEEIRMEKGDKITGRYGSKNIFKDYTLNNYHIIRYGAYTKLEEFFGKEELEKIIKYDTKTQEKYPYVGVGIKYFEDNFIYVLDHYVNANNTHLYNFIKMAYNRGIIFGPYVLNMKSFNKPNELLDILDMNVSHLVDTINSSDDEMENLENLYLLQKNMNFIYNYHFEKLKDNENKSESKDINVINPFPTATKERYSCCCTFMNGNKLMYDKLGKDYRCPVCNTKLIKIDEVK